MKTITSETLFNTHTFEVVEKIPANFFVWNIGKNMMHDDYIPICEDAHPGHKEDYTINQNTLKAIKLTTEEVMSLRNAASYGVNSLETARKALRSKRKGYMSNKKRELATMVIDIYKRITE